MLHLQQQMTCLDWIIDSAGPGVPESKNLADCLSKFRLTKFTFGSCENAIADSIPILILGNHRFQNFWKGTHVKIESE